MIDEATEWGKQQMSKEVRDDANDQEVTGNGMEAVEKFLVEGIDGSSGLVEAGGESLGGCAVADVGQDTPIQTDPSSQVTVETIMTNAPRDQLTKYTASDPTLETVTSLADQETEGYV